MEHFLQMRGSQWAERFLPIDHFPSPCWHIIDDCLGSRAPTVDNGCIHVNI